MPPAFSSVSAGASMSASPSERGRHHERRQRGHDESTARPRQVLERQGIVRVTPARRAPPFAGCRTIRRERLTSPLGIDEATTLRPEGGQLFERGFQHRRCRREVERFRDDDSGVRPADDTLRPGHTSSRFNARRALSRLRSSCKSGVCHKQESAHQRRDPAGRNAVTG